MLWILSFLPVPSINRLKKSYLKTLNLHQRGKYFIIIICCSWSKKNCHTFPRAYPQKKDKNIHFPEGYQILSYLINKAVKYSKHLVNHQKYLLKQQCNSLFRRFTKFPKILQPKVFEHYLHLIISNFTLFCLLRDFIDKK